MFNNKTVGLALSGGGMCGIAHLGVLQVLEDNNIIPEYICGTSIGALVGGLYASGMDAASIYSTTKKLNLFGLFDVNPLVLTSTHLIPGNAIVKILKKLTKEQNIEDLKCKFSCFAVDLVTGKQVEFKSGPLWQAIRASISVPMLFKPVEIGDQVLVDGGVLNNMPANNIKEKYNPDITISCDVLKKYHYRSKPKRWYTVMEYSFGLLQNRYNDLIGNNADYQICPNVSLSPFEFTKNAIEKTYNKGVKAANKEIAKLLEDYKDKK